MNQAHARIFATQTLARTSKRVVLHHVISLVMLVFALAAEAGSAADRSISNLKKLSVDQLMDIEVTSVSRHSEQLAYVASSIQVITQEDIRRSGAVSLPEALRLAPNLQVARIDARQWAISARGFNATTANKLLVLIVGRAVYTPLFAGVFWDAQNTNLADIERIEVISGPGATQWGANAVNGVINVTTKRAQDTQGLDLHLAAGDEQRAAGTLRYGGTLGNWYYRGYARYLSEDDVVLPNGAAVPTGWHHGQAGFRVDGELSRSDVLTVTGDTYRGSVEQPVPGDIEINGSNLVGRLTRTTAQGAELQFQAYIDHWHRRIPRSFDEDLKTYDIDFQYRLRTGARHGVTLGAGYRLIDDDIGNSTALAFLPAHVKRQWANAFIQDEIALPHRMYLTLGSKLEHNDYTGFEIQPSARLSWRVAEPDTLWSAVSRAVRTPSRIDREFFVPASPPFNLAGGAGFDSEELIAYELGYRTLRVRRTALSLATFYNDYDDLRSIERASISAPTPRVIGNGLKAQSYGIELVSEYQPLAAWRLRLGYTEFRIHFAHRPGSTDPNLGTSESHDPRRQIAVRSLLDLPAAWRLDASYRFVSRIENQDVPGYRELDVRLAWQAAPSLQFAINGRNLLHAHHPEFGSITLSPTSTRKEIERGVYAEVIWQREVGGPRDR
jgi:iron complex outermembrane receptor protein